MRLIQTYEFGEMDSKTLGGILSALLDELGYEVRTYSTEHRPDIPVYVLNKEGL